VERKVELFRPAVVAFLGMSAYRTAFSVRDAGVGPRPEKLAGSAVWLLPNPSGLNAHYQVPDLVREFRALREAL
jgi:TDG/mug DNA glycosylase family protein